MMQIVTVLLVRAIQYRTQHDVATLYHLSTKSTEEKFVKKIEGDSAFQYSPEKDSKLKDAKREI